MQQVNAQRKTLTERVIHAISFEGLATLILAPTAAWLMQRSVVEMGGLSILLATLAMVWNIIYNALFDRLWPVSRVVRNHLLERIAQRHTDAVRLMSWLFTSGFSSEQLWDRIEEYFLGLPIQGFDAPSAESR